MISTIIFDIGGVLVHLHWERLVSLMEGLSKLDPPSLRANAVKQAVMNGPIVESAMRGVLGQENFQEGLCRALEIDVSYRDFVNVWNQLLSENREITPIVEGLMGRYRLVLASNTDPIHSQRTVEICPALRYFNDRFLSHEMGLLKPEPEFSEYVLGRLEVKPNECLFIDDIRANIVSASNLGIRGLLFQNNEGLAEDLPGLLRAGS